MRLKKDKSGNTVGRPSWRSSLPGDPGAKFFCGKPQHMKNSLNFANTCLKVVDTRRLEEMLGGVKTLKRNDREPSGILIGPSIAPRSFEVPKIPSLWFWVDPPSQGSRLRA